MTCTRIRDIINHPKKNKKKRVEINQKVRKSCGCVSSKLRNNFLPPSNHFPKVRLINERKRNEFCCLSNLFIGDRKKFINFSHGKNYKKLKNEFCRETKFQ